MKFTGFATSCIGKLLLIILCMALGAVLALGGLAAGVYVTFTKDGGMGTVSDYANNAGIELKFDDDIKAMSVLGWVSEIMSSISSLSTSEIGSLERLLGSDLISRTIEDVLGVDAAKVSASTLDNLGKVVSDSLTIANVQDKFGIDFPDMPIFKNEDFLASPLSTAFGNFDGYKLGEILEINDDSNAVLNELKDVAIKDIGSSQTDTTVKSMLMCQLMDIDENSNKTLQALKYSCIESQYQTDASGNILENDGKKVYKTKRINENGTLKTVELIGINDTINSLCVKDVVDITDDSAVVLRKMRKPTEEEIAAGKEHMYGEEDLLVTDLAGSKVTEIVDNTMIGEIVDIVEEGENKSEPILIALKDTTVKGLNQRIKTLALTDIFDEEKLNDGVLSLISADTTIDGIPSALTNVMSSSHVATLSGKGIVNEDSLDNIGKLDLAQQAFIYNSNMSDLLSGLINFVNDPIDANRLSYDVANGTILWKNAVKYEYITPESSELTTDNYSSLTDFVADYAQFTSLVFLGATTVNIDPEKDAAFYNAETDTYYIPMFNVDDEDAVLTIENGTVKLAVYDVVDDGIALSKNQYGFYYSLSENALFDKGFDNIIYGEKE